MHRRKPVWVYPQGWVPPLVAAQFKLAAMVATAALPFFVLTLLLPKPLVLPVLSLVAIAGAAVVSIVAWRRNTVRDAQHVTAWDVAGALALIGCAAAMLSKPDQVLIYLVST